jgi:hypothetical protein
VEAEQPTPEEREEFLRGWSPDAAEGFREVAADMGFDLDYSPASLARVEELINTLPGRKGTPKKQYRELSGVTGAYLAEVILRNVGGEWAWEDELEAGGIRLPSRTFVFPLHKARKRYEDGPGDDLVSYYAVIERDHSEPDS